MNNKDLVLKSLQTIREMFEARELPEITQGLESYGEDEIDRLIESKNIFNIDVDNQLRIVYYLNPRFKTSEVKNKYFDDTVKKFDHLILVMKEKNPTSIKSLAKENLQIFDLKELQFNISKHHYVPKHRIVKDAAERNHIINNILVINPTSLSTKLPAILKTDPMAKFINAKTGDLVEITRYSPTSGEHIFYRICT